MTFPQITPAADTYAAPAYRPNVAAILRNKSGRILLGERLDFQDSWQFPQGGLDPGESAETGLHREVQEELSLLPTDYTILDRRGPYRYLFPAGIRKKKFHGQEQHYFLLQLIASEKAVNVATAHPEFRAVRWIEPAGFRIEWLPEMKHDVYRQVFRDFFGVDVL